MILWTFKLIRSVRKAIAGRKHPGQLAWGVALGALIGMIPHGNLLAVALVLFVLILHVNHAMAALVGVAVTFLAQRLDPMFDVVGRWCLEQPEVADRLALAWQYPLVPWTDLNNTIVVGSFLVGLIAVGPLYLITHPLFRAWAPVDVDADAEAEDAEAENDAKVDTATSRVARETNSDSTSEINHLVHRIDKSHFKCDSHQVDARQDTVLNASCAMVASAASPAESVRDTRDVPSQPIDAPSTEPRSAITAAASQPTARSGSVPSAVSTPQPTRVATGTAAPRPATKIRVPSGATQSNLAVDSYGSPVDEQHKIDEALSYLLRQLRDSKDKDAA